MDFNKQLNKIADYQAILGDYENRLFIEQTEQEIKLKNTENFILWLVFVFTVILTFIIFRSYRVKTKINRELQEALAKVKTLSGLLPICAACKKIRDDAGYWHQIEAYISTHSEAEFTHSICQECQQKLYPELFKKENDADPD